MPSLLSAVTELPYHLGDLLQHFVDVRLQRCTLAEFPPQGLRLVDDQSPAEIDILDAGHFRQQRTELRADLAIRVAEQREL